MTDTTTGIILLVLVSLAISALIHWRIRRFWLATLVAAPLASVAFIALATVIDGVMDAFAIVVFLVSLGVSIPAAVVVGAAFRASRD